MHANVADIFKAIGPAASIIFAAWIFVSFLQVRYDTSVQLYLEMLKEYRQQEESEARLQSLKENILMYRRRCALMNVASTIGLISAILLVIALIFGVFALVFAEQPFLADAAIILAVVGLLLIVLATVVVIFEGFLINQQLEHALNDIPDLASEVASASSSKPRRKKLGLVK